jgi:hypothetical protein
MGAAAAAPAADDGSLLLVDKSRCVHAGVVHAIIREGRASRAVCAGPSATLTTSRVHTRL